MLCLVQDVQGVRACVRACVCVCVLGVLPIPRLAACIEYSLCDHLQDWVRRFGPASSDSESETSDFVRKKLCTSSRKGGRPLPFPLSPLEVEFREAQCRSLGMLSNRNTWVYLHGPESCGKTFTVFQWLKVCPGRNCPVPPV